VGAFPLKFSIAPSGETIKSKKLGGGRAKTGRTTSITMPSMVGIVGRAPAVDEKVWCFFVRRPARSAAMSVLFSLRGSKMGFSPRRGYTLPR